GSHRGHQNVTTAELRHAKVDDRHDRVAYVIAQRREALAGPPHRRRRVAADGGHVLDEEVLRLEHFDNTGDMLIEPVLRIAPPRVVVERRKPLAGWPCQEDVYAPYLPTQPAFYASEPLARSPVNELCR